MESLVLPSLRVPPRGGEQIPGYAVAIQGQFSFLEPDDVEARDPRSRQPLTAPLSEIATKRIFLPRAVDISVPQGVEMVRADGPDIFLELATSSWHYLFGVQYGTGALSNREKNLTIFAVEKFLVRL